MEKLCLRKPKGDVSITFPNGIEWLKRGSQFVTSDRSIMIVKSIKSKNEIVARYAQWYDFVWYLMKSPLSVVFAELRPFFKKRKEEKKEGYVMQSREEHDRIFAERVKPFRDMAQTMGCDMQAFDARVASKKIKVDAFLESARQCKKLKTS